MTYWVESTWNSEFLKQCKGPVKKEPLLGSQYPLQLDIELLFIFVTCLSV